MVKRNLNGDMGMERSYKRSKSTPAQKAQKASVRKTAREVVYRMAEKKRVNSISQEQSINSISQGDTWVALSNISQGPAAYERVGKEVTLKKLRFKGQIHNNAAVTMVVRQVVGYFLDQGTPGVGTEMFEQSTRGSGTVTFSALKGASQEPLAPHLLLNRAKFIPVIDKVYKVGALAAVEAGNTILFDHSVNLRDRKIRFEQSAVGVGNQDIQLYAGCWCIEANNDITTGLAVEWTFNATVDYLDL